MTSHDTRGTIKSNETLFSIIDSLKDFNGAGVTELSDHLDISKSTVHKHLKSMKNHDLVVKSDDNTYHLSFKFLKYGGFVRYKNELCDIGWDAIKHIFLETQESCGFAIKEQTYGIYTHLEWGERRVPRTQPIGEQFYLHSNASGKAILSELSDDQVSRVIEEQGLPRLTENTITDENELFEEIQQIRDRGYSVNMEERFEGICSIGAGITHPDTGQVGALSIAAPAARVEAQELTDEYGDLLRSTINEIDLRIRFD